MKKIILFFVLLLPIFLLSQEKSFATENPLNSPNNKFGVHILFTSELSGAASLVNSAGGDWGYVTIPIQAGDKDFEKWQSFMDMARQLHIIPIIRLATEIDYFDTKVWKKPTQDDVLDFANFLNSLDWPVKNRYIVVFNEVNRSDEWVGDPNPGEYAQILSYAVDVFKSRSQDFFIISAGLDNASETAPGQSINEYTYLREMNIATPGIFHQIDGLASHSYPNPGFREPPWVLTNKSISSFRYEKYLADVLGNKDLPIFITETGWSLNSVSQDQVGYYYRVAFDSVWSDNSVVAVTPFLLRAGAGSFTQFSFIDNNGNKSQQYQVFENIPKQKGFPILNDASKFSGSYIIANNIKNMVPTKKFLFDDSVTTLITIPKDTIRFFKWLLGI